MDLVPWNPLHEFDRMRNTLDRVFSDPLRELGHAPWNMRMPVEVLERGDEVILRVELAGVDPKDVDVRVTDEGLTVRGERKIENNADREGIRHTERYYGSFVRSIAFPVPVDTAQAKATFSNGLLEVRAPKRNPNEGRDGRRLDIEMH